VLLGSRDLPDLPVRLGYQVWWAQPDHEVRLVQMAVVAPLAVQVELDSLELPEVLDPSVNRAGLEWPGVQVLQVPVELPDQRDFLVPSEFPEWPDQSDLLVLLDLLDQPECRGPWAQWAKLEAPDSLDPLGRLDSEVS